MPPELDAEEMCYECEGMGIVDCPQCGGTGEEFEEPCPECEGQCTVTCFECDGTGEAPVDPPEPGMMQNLPAPPGMKQEGYVFDRFMDDIIIKEGAPAANAKKSMADSPQRERARKHQERPLGRIRYGVK